MADRDLEKSPLNTSVNSGKGIRNESLSHLKNQHSKGSLKAESHALIAEASESGVKHPIILYLMALTLICMMTFGSYFIYDLPAVLDSDIKDHFAKKGKDYSDTMNLSLYSAYSYPNCVLCLIGGIIADKIGLRIATIIFLACIMTGQFLVAIGISTTSYPLMLFGRVVFGLGGESLSATQSAYCARWFKKSGVMALAFGITLSFSRVGSSVGLIVQPAASSSLGVVFAAWVGLMMCVVSFVTVVLLSILDKYGEKRGIVISVNAGEDFRLSDLKSFPGPMFILAGICVLAYCAVFPFNGIAPDFFKYKWNSGNNAATFLSVYTFVSAGGSPIIGFLVDRAGRSVSWIGGSCVGLAAVHLVLRFGPTDLSYFPIFPMVILGIALSMLGASLWPCVPYILAPNFLGTGYGLMLALQNFGLATIPLVVGIVKDHVQGMNAYYYNLYIFLGCCGGGFVLSALLFILDKKNNGLLNCDPKERERRKEEIDLLGSINEQ